MTAAGGRTLCENELLLCVYMMRLFPPRANMDTEWLIASTVDREVTEYVVENCRDGHVTGPVHFFLMDRTGHMASFVTQLKPVSLPPQGLLAA